MNKIGDEDKCQKGKDILNFTDECVVNRFLNFNFTFFFLCQQRGVFFFPKKAHVAPQMGTELLAGSTPVTATRDSACLKASFLVTATRDSLSLNLPPFDSIVGLVSQGPGPLLKHSGWREIRRTTSDEWIFFLRPDSLA